MANTILHKSSSVYFSLKDEPAVFSVLPQVPLLLVDADVSSKSMLMIK
jgi:hypothetical protein